MSGIAGIVRFDGAPLEPGLIERMTAAMAHRGPDGIRHWSSGSVALGQCMLCTTPESLDERGPLANEDGSLVLVIDGRVDNWEELRRDLLGRGAVLRDRTDAELVLRAYEVWGRECPAHVDGDFAFVVWDARRREAFCARDRMANKAIAWHWDGNNLAFASELRAILALPWVPRRLNEGMVAEFLANEWHSRDETFWQNVHRLEPAHRMTVDAAGPRQDRYWQPDPWTAPPSEDEDELVEHYLSLLTDVVRRMSRSTGPLACEVSGGLDSSALFAVAEHLRRRGELLAPSLDGYTLAFDDGSDADELSYARAVGEHLGVPIREIAPTTKPLDWYRERARRYHDFPSYPNGVMGLGIREHAVARGSRALLVGVGGDEWLGGSRLYYAEALAEREWRTLYECWSADRRDVGVVTSLGWLARSGLAPFLSQPVKRSLKAILSHAHKPSFDTTSWLAPALREDLKQRRQRDSILPASMTKRAGQRRQVFTILSVFAAQARELEERLASDAGIEIRRPYLDRRIVEFAFATPERFRLRGLTNRLQHRKAMRGLLPPTVAERQSKADFVVTFRKHLPELRRSPFGEAGMAGKGWVDAAQAANLLNRVGASDLGGAPEWMAWSLMGCMALCDAK